MKTKSGFTIVELLIVIVIISVLAVIMVIAYNGVSARADYSKAQSDLVSIQKGLDTYKVRNGSYPVTAANCTTSTAWYLQSAMGDGFLPGIKPTYMAQIPSDKLNTGDNTYSYCSDGTNYKLLRQRDSTKLLPSIERQNNPLIDPVRTTTAWGYWTPGASSW